MSRIEIYTDGACGGNPGPGGWGALLSSGVPGNERVDRLANEAIDALRR